MLLSFSLSPSSSRKSIKKIFFTKEEGTDGEKLGDKCSWFWWLRRFRTWLELGSLQGRARDGDKVGLEEAQGPHVRLAA